MESKSYAFGSYKEVQQAEAALNQFIESGFPASDITVLLSDNTRTVEFARRRGTRLPSGTGHGPQADQPLQGSLGILHPAEGPRRGALDDALDGMGVPLDWPHGVLEGKALVSVQTADVDAALAAFSRTGAVDAGTSTPKSQAA